ncbi:MAG: hypothetical protein L0Z62_27700 [Gemmataceae bacterium]|nr:hypothetical protein [Gemmataceae bacterium]
MLFNRENWAPHRPWLFFCLVIFAFSTGWYFLTAFNSGTWPGGSSLPGLTLGIVGGAICLFEFLLWLRKRVRVWRIGRAQVWLRAHIWLGLLCVPLLIYHSGFRFGGLLSTVLMVLVLVVVASGIWGLVMQQLLPKRMLEEIPAETIYSQIDRLSEQLTVEADGLVRATCGPLPDEQSMAMSLDQLTMTRYVVVGAVRSAGQVQGKVLDTRVPASPVEDCEPLRAFFHQTLILYLRGGAKSGSPLSVASKANWIFQDLKTKLPPAAHEAVDILAGFCDQRRQWDQQARLHNWLHNWLLIHFPLSVALIVLMFVHVYVALKYW